MRKIQVNFDRLAPFYRSMEFIAAGGKLQRCRMAFLAEIPAPRRILLAGEGNGRSLPEYVKRFPHAQITVIDLSERMLAICRNNVCSDQVEFVQADLLEWDQPRGRFDLIVTNFFLDCFPADELALVISILGKRATPDAHWLLADFEIATTPLARLRGRMVVGILYAFFRITTDLKASTLVPPQGDLEKAGFSLHRRKTHDRGLLKSEWWRRGEEENSQP